MYVEVRNKLTFTVWDLLRLTNVTPKVLFSSVNDIVKVGGIGIWNHEMIQISDCLF